MMESNELKAAGMERAGEMPERCVFERRAAAAPVGSVGDDELMGAVARGWCHKSCAHKVMDEQLAYAITREVSALLAARAAPGVPADIDSMVNRFLGWPLPHTLLPDGCVMKRDYPHRIGTHLMTADEAKAMFEYVLAGLDAPVEQRPTNDDLWDATLRDRDTYQEWADKLAEAISKHFGAYIGEHSNMNCPWAEALEAIEAADPVPAVPAPVASNKQCDQSNVVPPFAEPAGQLWPGLSGAILETMYKAFHRGDSVERVHAAVMALVEKSEQSAAPVPRMGGNTLANSANSSQDWLNSSAPAAPIDRDSVLEEAAKACDFQASWARGEANDGSNSDAYRNDQLERQIQADVCADEIRRLKSTEPAPLAVPLPADQSDALVAVQDAMGCIIVKNYDLAYSKLKAAIPALAVPLPLPAGPSGWQQEAELLRNQLMDARRRLDLQEIHQEADVWYWVGDGTDHPESFSNSMAVVIRGDQLRALAAAPATPPAAPEVQDAARYRHMRNLTVEQAGMPGQPSIALPNGMSSGYYITEETADYAVDQSIAEAMQREVAAAPTQTGGAA